MTPTWALTILLNVLLCVVLLVRRPKLPMLATAQFFTMLFTAIHLFDFYLRPDLYANGWVLTDQAGILLETGIVYEMWGCRLKPECGSAVCLMGFHIYLKMVEYLNFWDQNFSVALHIATVRFWVNIAIIVMLTALIYYRRVGNPTKETSDVLRRRSKAEASNPVRT